MYTLLYLNYINQQRPAVLVEETLPKVMWQPGWEGSLGGKWIHVYVWLSPFAVHLKLSQHCQSAIVQYKIKSFKKEAGNTFKQLKGQRGATGILSRGIALG